MSKVTTTRRIRLIGLGFPASQRPVDATTFEVEAHDEAITESQLRTAVDAAPTDTSDANAASLRTQADQVISTLENATRTKATWDGLTAAQRQEATRIGLLAVAKIARLVLGRLDSA